MSSASSIAVTMVFFYPFKHPLHEELVGIAAGFYKDRFSKRDVFVATSDLCRSFVVLSVLALMPAIRITLHEVPFQKSILPFAFLLLVLASTATLAWKRMVRFRALAEATVFRAYLATLGPEPNVSVTTTTHS